MGQGTYVGVDAVDVDEVEKIVDFDLGEWCNWEDGLNGFKLSG